MNNYYFSKVLAREMCALIVFVDSAHCRRMYFDILIFFYNSILVEFKQNWLKIMLYS